MALVIHQAQDICRVWTTLDSWVLIILLCLLLVYHIHIQVLVWVGCFVSPDIISVILTVHVLGSRIQVLGCWVEYMDGWK